MGIGYTLQGLEGWNGHYQRVLRWHSRVRQAANGEPSADELDFLLAFFEGSFHLRDWLLADGSVDQAAIEALFQTHVELRVCRDIANGFKHREIIRPSVDARFSIVNESVPKDWPSEYRYPNGKWTILANGNQFGLVELADRCVAIWRQFLIARGLLPVSPGAETDA